MRYLPLCLFVFLLACNNTPTTTQQESAPTQSTATYPAYPADKLQFLFNNADYIDYVFYELPISMSLNEKPSVQYAITHISGEPTPIVSDCKSIGRVFYQQAGEEITSAEIYFNENKSCSYFMFYDENGKKAYVNAMAQEGINYLRKNIMQVYNMAKQNGAAAGGGAQ